jgi:hypothetical protein
MNTLGRFTNEQSIIKYIVNGIRVYKLALLNRHLLLVQCSKLSTPSNLLTCQTRVPPSLHIPDNVSSFECSEAIPYNNDTVFLQTALGNFTCVVLKEIN